jgi:hypothetical protein
MLVSATAAVAEWTLSKVSIAKMLITVTKAYRWIVIGKVSVANPPVYLTAALTE